MSNPVQNKYFPSLIFFVLFSIFFLDLGILFGSLNAFRLALGEFMLFGTNILDPNLILLTHWTNTLLGGLSLIMLGQIYFFFSYANKEKFSLQYLTLIFLFIWLLGIISNYLASWVNFSYWHGISSLLFLIAITLYILVLFFSIIFSNRVTFSKENIPLMHLSMALMWMWIAIFFFQRTSQNALGSLFLNTYVFGFFTFVLFGSLFFILPKLFNQKKPSTFTVVLHFILLFFGHLMIFLDEFFTDILNTPIGGVVGLFLPVIGTVLYTGAFLIFLLWLADFIFRTGLSPSLIGLLIAMLMMSFFVIDTLMSVIFPQWVEVNHVHFIFLGALLLTIISVGTKLISVQYSQTVVEETRTWDFKEFIQASKFRIIVIFLAIGSVGMILLSFTVQNSFFAGIFGLVLFIAIILVNIELFFRIRRNKAV